MPRAVRFSRYGGPEVLEIAEVGRPRPGAGQVLVRVVVAAINPGEIGIREGAFADIWPAAFPEGQGNDFAGWVAGTGEGVTGFAVGDEVIGFAPRAGQADYVALPAHAVTHKPAEISWEEAAPLSAAGTTAWAAVNAVAPKSGETVVVSAAAGGVGIIAAQLTMLRGGMVIGTASEHSFEFLRSYGVVPVRYGLGMADRIRAAAPTGVDAYIDNFGNGNVDVAIELGVQPSRINTITDGRAVVRYGVHGDAQVEGFTPAVMEELVGLVAQKRLVVPVATVYPLEQVRDAYIELARRHTRGKILLSLVPEPDRLGERPS
jgi:NADPH:quinone reductase-like Zn-dependent oxidoreductase